MRPPDRLRRAARIAGEAVLVGLVYWLNTHTPSDVRLGILYIVPVLLATWHDGLAWGSVFAIGTALLRYVIGLEQMPSETAPIVRIANEAAYLAVVGVAMAGLVQLRRTTRSPARSTPARSPSDSARSSIATDATTGRWRSSTSTWTTSRP